MLHREARLGLLTVALLGLGGFGCAGAPVAKTGDAGAESGSGSGGRGLGGALGIDSGAWEGLGGSIAPGCDGSCDLRIPEGCGDGINNQGGIEACDDGNTIAGDGCNGICQVEPNWICPPAGECTRNFACGDSVVNPGEVCDDGNTDDLDGCSADCSYQAPGYSCTPGQKCVSTSICGNRRIEPGEACDDGDTDDLDGCSATCALEPGWICPVPGTPCKHAARCGDGVVNVNLGELCDDGNTDDLDGCSADCKVKAAGCDCVPGQKCKCPQAACGDGVIQGDEKCDDGNSSASDGCSSTCEIEPGYQCPLVAAPCLANCGDGLVVGSEQCDPGVAIPNLTKACTATCRWAPGWACTGTPPTSCHATVCGDGLKEGAEGCDDGDTKPYDGCSQDCQVEPVCTTSGCTSLCGDGLLLGEACDDGNTIGGDGCSATCQTEPGFSCSRPPLGDHIDVPIVYRDFRYHSPSDFEPNATGQTTATTGLVASQLDSAGKPVLAAPGGTSWIASATTFSQWYRDTPGVNHSTAAKLRLYKNTSGGYVNRWGANGEGWPIMANAYYCGNVGAEKLDANGQPIPCTSKWGSTECDSYDTAGYPRLSCTQANGNWVAVYLKGSMDGNPVFFPVDADTFSTERDTAKIPAPYASGWPEETGKPPHNFSFTSEVRYWFPYDSTKSYTLDFLGDDDVWVFVNKKLAVDLGGIHEPVQGSITISSANAGAFGMTDGKVYEIVVFQAERQTTASSYKLTLSGFNGATSVCGPTCGDGVVTPGERCDNGAQNLGGYNQCTPDCKLGPHCGDGNPDAGHEECDNGTNQDVYGAGTGCAPGCKLPARCGDGTVQAEYGETCDDGINDGQYTGCTSDCQRAAFCGDGKVSPVETCDDGVNDGSYGTCGNPGYPLPNCGPAPHCGDGEVQDAYGEECEPIASNDPNCTHACRKPGLCGDGLPTPPEQCDYGAASNTGEYGGCSPGCRLAPHCGDGIKNGPEECDDGILDNSYGGCSPQCKLAPHCGDGHTDAPYEECDAGAANGNANVSCTSTCKLIVG